MAADCSLLRGWAALTALMAAASLLLQYLLLVQGPGAAAGIGVATLRFFGYFTILSNLAVCVGCGWLVLGRVLKPAVAASLALCIGVTACVYVLALQGLWQPTGLQWWVDAGLHYVVPALFLLGWLLLLPHGELRWRALGGVLLVPLAYLGWDAGRCNDRTGAVSIPRTATPGPGGLPAQRAARCGRVRGGLDPAVGAGPLAPSMRRCRAIAAAGLRALPAPMHSR